ncbi:hypothetical protein, conserved [Plasmodium gonderi]|uniref:tRNA(His) guanylyltransferase n=1 Tax=Plasmodium gonderi TaxID=77519 RepID=A0A1Y1JA39_PLAGO|nr:hypothetical protein, conserved [Plasmodium gonderi]GAW79369.1 hypothetical protein, conserved [Plasmodium gonderi]
MANSKFAYVKQFEEEKRILLNCYFIVRIDGSDFKKFTKTHVYTKPNDIRGLNLMNSCAKKVMNKFDEIDLAYGHSDEYSFLFRKKAKIWNRRYDKILTNVVSYFTSSFIYQWKFFFSEQELVYPPCFDARIIIFPTEKETKDYFSWRQVDCHINTQYNECFWNLIQKANYSKDEAYKFLLTTQKKEKNELLFSRFGINYNDLPEIFRRGSIIIRNSAANTTRAEVNTDIAIDCVEKQKQGRGDEDLKAPIVEEKRDDAFTMYTPTKQTKESMTKLILSHENLVCDRFWNKYGFVFDK